VVSDGLALAFADATFDAVTSAFMMRNVPDIDAALAEQVRVVRPGGAWSAWR
jgi:demethylmenaquinone methyltransferase / 2-methoxy-6-polyprenyl-1,4-benzoquinol methylase